MAGAEVEDRRKLSLKKFKHKGVEVFDARLLHEAEYFAIKDFQNMEVLPIIISKNLVRGQVLENQKERRLVYGYRYMPNTEGYMLHIGQVSVDVRLLQVYGEIYGQEALEKFGTI